MEATVEVKFLAKPIPAPGDSHVRYVGGRLTYYGAISITANDAVEPAAAISITTNDVVTVRSNDQGAYPFLAQVCAVDYMAATFIGYAEIATAG